MDRTQVLEQMRPVLDTKVIPIEGDKASVVVIGADGIAIRPSRGARSIEFDPSGAEAFYGTLGIGKETASRLSPPLRARVASELLQRKEDLTLLVKDHRVTDLAPRLRGLPVQPEHLLRTIERVIPEAEYNRVNLLPHHIARLEVIGVEEHPVVKGDLVRAGALVTFSPIGTIAPIVSSYVMRLICTNGATSQDVLRQFNYGHGQGGEGDDVWQFFRKGIREAYRAVEHIAGRWKEMAEKNILPEDRPAILAALLRQAGLSKEVAGAVQARALQEPPQTEYDMLNLITWASSHLERNPVLIARAQASASRFASSEEHEHLCPTCNRTGRITSSNA